MQISNQCLELIKGFEGLHLNAYRCPAGKLTIGYGHTGPDVCEGQAITAEDADKLLRADLKRFEDGVTNAVGAMTQGHFDALVSFAFNLGLSALNSSTLLKLHKAGQHPAAAAEFGRWVNSGGRKLEGLVKRRAAEAALYQS